MLKKFIFYLVIVFAFLLLYFFSNPNQKEIKIRSTKELQQLFKTTQNDISVFIAPGDYQLEPTAFIDSTCANCEEPKTGNPATYGLKISGNNIKITGTEDRSAVIHTNSGYGIFIENCQNLILENLTITDGISDSAAMASDAAIVVKNSRVKILNNLISANLGDSLLIVKSISGIMGICGRDNSYLEITDNDIIRNSWDGIALYRDTEAIITGNNIDGIDKAGGRTAKGGRGVAIGVTWNAKAKISNNYIARYWKGIGLFVDAVGIVENNLIEDMSTWGISLWDAGKGKPQGFIKKNIIYNTGAMGAAITTSRQENPGFFKQNIIVKTAQNPAYDSPEYYGFQCALALHSVPDVFLIEENLFHQNRIADKSLPDYDVGENVFVFTLHNETDWLEEIKFLKKSAFWKSCY